MVHVVPVTLAGKTAEANNASNNNSVNVNKSLQNKISQNYKYRFTIQAFKVKLLKLKKKRKKRKMRKKIKQGIYMVKTTKCLAVHCYPKYMHSLNSGSFGMIQPDICKILI